MNELLYDFRGSLYPFYLKDGNAMRFIEPVAKLFCVGEGLDVGASKWCLPGATPWELKDGCDGMQLPDKQYDYIFSSHALEHINDAVGALLHWKSRLKPGGVLFLYLPSKAMRYWNVSSCRRHRHQWEPAEMATILSDLGFTDIIFSERDMAWSFCVIAFNGPRSV